jgi:hypothetical protein
MRFNREIIGIAILLLLFVLAAMVMSGRDNSKSRLVGSESTPEPSIYNDRSSGSKAFYEYVGKLGYETRAWRREWSKLGESNAKVLIAVEPSSTEIGTLTGPFNGGNNNNSSNDDSDTPSTLLKPEDAGHLENWLRAGRTAIILTSKLQDSKAQGTSDPTFADAIHISVTEASGARAVEDFAPEQAVPVANGVISVHAISGMRIASNLRDLVPLFGDSSGPVVAAMPVGNGRLILISDGEFASNDMLGRSDNAVFMANLLAHYSRPGDRVLFDEFHHGDADLGGLTLWGALGRPLQLATVQILLAILVAFAVAAVRFGSPIPLIRAGERTTAEYVTSLSSLYWKAGASTTALEMIYRQFLRELTSRLGLSADVSLEQVADAAARRGGASVMEMRRVLALCEQHIDTGKISEAELLDLVRRMDRIRKDIGIA